MASGQALAASNVNITNTETIQAHLNADGSVQDARVYEQIALQGDGTVTINNPVSTENLRNLDGFGNFEVKNGNMVSTQTVNGEKRLRSVSDFGKKLPLTVAVIYKLDGKTVSARDVVGKSGLLEVHYTVANVTGKAQDVTFDDGTGKMITENQQVVVPMVGSLTTVLPSNFTDVRSGEASMAGDGSGGTSMTFTMTLFNPIATPTAEFGYSAQIKDGLIPPANVSALPVNPLESPSFKGGAASYKGGADSGITLTAGAVEIDANVLKLRDGAQTLIAGLIQLRDGAGQLDTAFNNVSGEPDLASGGAALTSGVAQISTGLKQLSGVQGLPSALAGLQDLRAGLDHPVGALGKTDPGGLLQGLQQLAGGLSNPACNPANPSNPANPCGVKQGLASVKLGVSNPACSLADPTNVTNPCGIKQIVDYVGGKLTAASATGGDIATLGGAVIGAYQQSLMAPATHCPTASAVPVPPGCPAQFPRGAGSPNHGCLLPALVGRLWPLVACGGPDCCRPWRAEGPDGGGRAGLGSDRFGHRRRTHPGAVSFEGRG